MQERCREVPIPRGLPAPPRGGYEPRVAKIRGMAFLGAARHVKRERGLEGLARVIRDAGPEAQATFSRPINGLSLQPYAAFVGLLVSVDRHLGCGDLEYCRVIGDLSARHDLSTIFKVYAVRPSPETMIRACTPIWGMYTEGCGVMEAVDTRPDSTLLRICDFDAMHPAHCRLMEGWMIAAMSEIGVRILPGAGERACPSRGGTCHEFWCQWEPKPGEPA